jgi:hypothetical protein
MRSKEEVSSQAQYDALYSVDPCRLAPKYPRAADTLVFVMLKRVLPKRGLPLFHESTATRRKSPQVNHHLAGAAQIKPAQRSEGP